MSKAGALVVPFTLGGRVVEKEGCSAGAAAPASAGKQRVSDGRTSARETWDACRGRFVWGVGSPPPRGEKGARARARVGAAAMRHPAVKKEEVARGAMHGVERPLGAGGRGGEGR